MGPSLDARRRNWAARQWCTSECGSWFTNARGFNVTVFATRRGWAIRFVQRFGDRQQWGKQRFKTANEAKERAFDAILWCERTWAGNGRHPFAPQGARA